MHSKPIKPILIIGTQRSGSNLLRLMLNQCAEIDAPHPPHLLQVFTPLVPFYKSTFGTHYFNILVADVCKYVNLNPVPWQYFKAHESEVLQECRGETLIEVFRSVYYLKAKQSGALYWCCKSMANIYFLDEIEKATLHPFYIHLIRDARDVAASFKNAIVGDKHVYFIAQQWQKEQELAFAFKNKIAVDNFALLRYEDFIRSPQEALIGILKTLGIDWSENIDQYYLSKEALATANAGTMWGNVIKPVDQTNTKHYSEKLSAFEVEIIESVAGVTMEKFGYPCNTSASLLFGPEDIARFKTENEFLKKQSRIRFPSDAESRAGQERLLKNIHAKVGYSI